MILGREVEVGIFRLYAEHLGAFVLILVEGFYGGYIPKRYFFGGVAIDLLVFEGVEVGTGEHHPAFLPLPEDAGSLDQVALLYFVAADIVLY